jgi:hypothetical protein
MNYFAMADPNPHCHAVYQGYDSCDSQVLLDDFRVIVQNKVVSCWC